MRDELVRAITADGLVKAVAVTGRDLVERAREIHTLLPMATAALGRTLLAASMMGDMLKIDGASLTLQIKGGGPLGTVLAVSDNSGNVRGYVQDPHVELREKAPGKLDVGWAVGTAGNLTVIKDLGMSIIGRAFAMNPDLLLMDEPYGQMDIKLRFYLEDEVVRLWKETGSTVLFITHNIEEAVYLAERILILSNKPTTIKEDFKVDLPRPR